MSVDRIGSVREADLFGEIVTCRLACNLPGDGDENVFRRHYGPQGSFLFWRNFLDGIVNVPNLIQRLTHARAENWQQIDVVRGALGKALLEAFQGDATFFRGNLEELKTVSYFHEISKPHLVNVLGRPAAEWLAASPKWRHLVAPTLAAFLLGKKPAITTVGQDITPAKRGPKGGKTDDATTAIFSDLRSGNITLEELFSAKQDGLALRYQLGSRSTFVTARGRAVSQFNQNINSDK